MEEISPEQFLDRMGPILDQAQRQRVAVASALRQYKEENLSMWMLGRASGRTEASTVQALAATAGHPIRAGNFEQGGWPQGEEHEAVVLTESTLASLGMLGMLEPVLRGLDVRIPRHVIEELEAHSRAPARRAESGADETPAVGPVPRLDRAIIAALCREHATLVNGLDLLRLRARDVRSLERHLGPGNARAIAYSRHHGLPIVTDDWVVGGIANVEFNRPWINTKGLVHQCLRMGTITVEEAQLALARMHRWGYTGVGLDGRMIVTAIEQAGWDATAPDASSVVTVFAEADHDPAVVARVLTSTIVELWNRAALPTVRESALERMLDQLAQRADAGRVGQIVLAALPVAFGLHVVGADQASAIVGAWLKNL